LRESTVRPIAAEKELDFSLRDLTAPLLRRKRLLLFTFLGILALAVTFILVSGPKYESHLSILVSRERQDPLVTAQATGQLMGQTPALTDEEINSEAELLVSSDILEKVVQENGMYKSDGKSLLDLLHPNENDQDRTARAVRGLARKIKVETPTKTNLIEVSYDAGHPERAYNVLKSLSNYYLQKHAEVHRPQGSFEFFSRETERYKAALDASEAKLRDLGQKHNVADPDEERSDLAQQYTNDIGQLHMTEQQIAADQQRIFSDQEQIRSTPERAKTKETSDAAEVLLQQLGVTELATETKRTQLLLKYQPDYPLVKETDQELADVRAAIDAAQKAHYVNQDTDRDPGYELLREDLMKTRADLSAQQASLAANQRSVDAMQHEMVSLGDQSLQVADLTRELKDNEQNYLLYLSKREQARTEDALDRNRIENIAIAVPPAIPVLPVHGVFFNLAIAMLASAFLSIALAYLKDFLDPSFHSPNQVAEVLGMPVIAINKRSA
jgi:uncharacterized protein involved in exopolysaccharide biosynthesis